MYDDNSNICHLYNFTETVTTGPASGKTYIVRDDCSWVESVYQVNVTLNQFVSFLKHEIEIIFYAYGYPMLPQSVA